MALRNLLFKIRKRSSSYESAYNIFGHCDMRESALSASTLRVRVVAMFCERQWRRTAAAHSNSSKTMLTTSMTTMSATPTTTTRAVCVLFDEVYIDRTQPIAQANPYALLMAITLIHRSANTFTNHQMGCLRDKNGGGSDITVAIILRNCCNYYSKHKRSFFYIWSFR